MSSRSIHERLVVLEKQMQAAAEAMDFEEATRLRNEMARIRGEAPVQAGDPDTVTVSQPPPGAMGKLESDATINPDLRDTLHRCGVGINGGRRASLPRRSRRSRSRRRYRRHFRRGARR